MGMPTKLICTYPDCGRKHVARGWCHVHYELERAGEPMRPIKQYGKRDPVCSYDGCGQKTAAVGLCTGHYRQKALGKQLKPLRFVRTPKYEPGLLCEFDGCDRAPKSRGLCAAHYAQLLRSGNPWALTPIGVCLCGASFEDTRRKKYCSDECSSWGQTASKYKTQAEAIFAFLKQQAGACAICETKKRRLYVDHCHDTGLVRGLLCPACNTGIGLLGDNAETLSKAVAYLQG